MKTRSADAISPNLSEHKPEERRFRALVDQFSDFIAILDAGSLLSFANLALETFAGVRVSNRPGRSFLELVAPEDRDAAAALVKSALASPSEVFLPWRLRLRHADGTVRWVEGTAANRVDDPFVEGIMVSGHEVPARAQAEDALGSQEELLRQAVRVSGMGIFEHDQMRGVIYWSPEQRAIFGWGPDEPVIVEDVVGLLHPEDAAEVAASVQRAHEPTGDGVWGTEHRIVRRDGSVRWLVARSQTFFEGAGAERRPVRTVGVYVDVTERRLAEEALRLKDKAIATALNAIAITDDRGRIIYVNQAFLRLWGYDSEREVIGRTFVDFVEPEATARLLEMLVRMGSYTGELVAMRKDGKPFEIMLTANVMRDATGRVVNLMGCFLDISDAKRMLVQLAQAQKMESVGRLAGGVAHDFNNLLTVIRGNLELAFLNLGTNPRLRADLTEASKAVDSAATLTQQLLAFSRKQTITPQTLDLNQVVEKVRKMLHRLLGEDIELRAVCAEGLWPVRFDLGQSEQVIVNLAVNARDAMPAGGKLLLETANVRLDEEYSRHHTSAPAGDYVMLAISDTGVGMTEDVRAHIFEPFFTTKGPGTGTGLGLAMVYGAVAQNSGAIEVYSEVGHGTTFKIYLPRATREAEPIKTASATSTLTRGVENLLLVEDDEAVRAMVTRALGLAGYHVRAFATPSSALEAVRDTSERIHLLITDVVMPGMNGRVLADQITRLRPGVPVLFTSGYTANVIGNHGVLEDGEEFLSKPYSLSALTGRVRAMLDKTAARER